MTVLAAATIDVPRIATFDPVRLCDGFRRDQIEQKLPEPARMASVKTDEMEKKETRQGSLKIETFVVNNF
jgi:hypothetical protein